MRFWEMCSSVFGEILKKGEEKENDEWKGGKEIEKGKKEYKKKDEWM